MKIAISTRGKSLDDTLDPRFGRASGFIIYETETNKFNFIDNIQNLEASQGAGIQAAQTIVNQNVTAIVTGHCGPKAFKVLSVAGIKIYLSTEDTVSNIIQKFKNNELKEIQNPDVEGHWV